MIFLIENHNNHIYTNLGELFPIKLSSNVGVLYEMYVKFFRYDSKSKKLIHRDLCNINNLLF